MRKVSVDYVVFTKQFQASVKPLMTKFHCRTITSRAVQALLFWFFHGSKGKHGEGVERETLTVGEVIQ